MNWIDCCSAIGLPKATRVLANAVASSISRCAAPQQRAAMPRRS